MNEEANVHYICKAHREGKPKKKKKNMQSTQSPPQLLKLAMSSLNFQPMLDALRHSQAFRAIVCGGIISGLFLGGTLRVIPSILYALVSGAGASHMFDSVGAAGSIVAGVDGPLWVQYTCGLLVHWSVAIAWGTVLWLAVPLPHEAALLEFFGRSARKPPVVTIVFVAGLVLLEGLLIGYAIWVVGFVWISQMFPLMRELPSGAQLVDHASFGAVTLCSIWTIKQVLQRARLAPRHSRPHPKEEDDGL